MPKRLKKPYSKKVKNRAPIRESFKEEFVDGENVLAVQFAHRDNLDVLVVTLDEKAWVKLPEEYMGYPVVTRIGRA